MSENIEQKIKLTFENNADENAKDVNKLTASIDKTKDAQENTVKENSKVENSYKSLRVQLREATVEQQRLSAQYGSTSKEAIGATKAVARLKDEMQFQKDLVKSYNPDEKFRGLTQTAGIAALALGGVSDGFKALGIESKGLDQVLGSAQAILGVTSAVAGMSDAYKILTISKKAKAAADVTEAAATGAVTVATGGATAATWSWNAALLANPIVLIAAGIVAAGAAIYALVKIMSNAASEEEKLKVKSMQLATAIDNQEKSFTKNNNALKENNGHKIALLKASGASEAQIYKETKALKAQELQLARTNEAQALLNLKKAIAANIENPTEFNNDAQKKAQEAFTEAKKNVIDSNKDIRKINQEHEVSVVQAQTDARKKVTDDAKAAREKAKADRKAELEKEYKEEQDLIRSQGEGARERYEAAEKVIADAKKANEDALKTENQIKVEKENADFELKKQSLIEKGLSIEEIEKEHKRKLAVLDDEYFAGEADKAIKKTADEKEAADKAAEDEKTVAEAKEANYQTNLGNLQTILSVGGKKLAAISKALAIADIARSAYNSISSTISSVGIANAKSLAASPLTGGMPFIGYNVAQGALSIGATIASSAMAIKNIVGENKTVSRGGGGGGSTSGGGGTVSASAAPQVNFQASKENQIGNTIAGRLNEQAPIRVTVLENDITKVQANVQAKVVSNSF